LEGREEEMKGTHQKAIRTTKKAKKRQPLTERGVPKREKTKEGVFGKGGTVDLETGGGS